MTARFECLVSAGRSASLYVLAPWLLEEHPPASPGVQAGCSYLRLKLRIHVSESSLVAEISA